MYELPIVRDYRDGKVTKEDLHMPKLQMGEDTYAWWNVLKKGITFEGSNLSVSLPFKIAVFLQ